MICRSYIQNGLPFRTVHGRSKHCIQVASTGNSQLMLDGQSFQPDEILVQEQLQMIDYSSGTDTSESWELDGLPDHHIQLMITRLIDSPVGQLRSLPRIQLQGSNVCDTGGVFRAKINETFDYLLRQSDLFTLNQVSRRYSFTPHSHVSLQRKRRQYQVLGKILYWFVIIHDKFPIRQI